MRMIEPLEGDRLTVWRAAQVYRGHRTPTEEALWHVVADLSWEVGRNQKTCSESGQERLEALLGGEGLAELFRDGGEQLCHEPLTGDCDGCNFFF